MRFSELSIQTQRAAPSEFSTEGVAFLYRAGYISRAMEFLPLGQQAVDRLRQAARAQDPQVFFRSLALPVVYAMTQAEYFALNQAGSEEILYCPACQYAARRELAHSQKLPFTTEALLPVEKFPTPECSTIAQLALFMGIAQEKTAKALMFTRLQDGKFIFVVIRGDMQLSEAKLTAAVGEVRLATVQEISASGAIAGYASPIGLRGAMVVVDELIANSPNMVAGANEAGYHLVNTNYPRDYQADLVIDLTLSTSGDACGVCGKPLESQTAIGVFSNGEVLFDKLLLTLAELHHDEKGLTLPALAAPYDIYLMQVPGKTIEPSAAAESLYTRLTAAGLSVLFDDRNERAGVKFADADLIGCPVRVTVGERGLQNGMLEIKLRYETENKQIALSDVISEIRSVL